MLRAKIPIGTREITIEADTLEEFHGALSAAVRLLSDLQGSSVESAAVFGAAGALSRVPAAAREAAKGFWNAASLQTTAGVDDGVRALAEPLRSAISAAAESSKSASSVDYRPARVTADYLYLALQDLGRTRGKRPYTPQEIYEHTLATGGDPRIRAKEPLGTVRQSLRSDNRFIKRGTKYVAEDWDGA